MSEKTNLTSQLDADAQPKTGSVSESAIFEVAVISLLGASVEWYDFFLYGAAAAAVFPKVFFSSNLPPLIGVIASFATFAVGFIARPVGGIIFGHFGDKLGRKGTLVTALMLMGGSTTLIGLLPTYVIVGAWAPAALIVLRFLQGIAIGGQWGGAMLLATESAPKRRRGFYGSFAQAGAPLGVILANLALLLVSANLSEHDFMVWGWRVPFLISAILVAVALYVQLRLEETVAFRALLELKQIDGQGAERNISVTRGRSPVLTVLASHPKQIILAAGAFVAIQVAFYILVSFVIAYGAARVGLHIPRNTMLGAVLIGALVQTPVIFLSGALSDRFGRRGLFMMGAGLLAVWSFAVFPLIDTGQFLWICVALAVAQACIGLMYGPQAAFFAELFSTEVRYSGASLGYQLGAILGGAFAPLVATALLAAFGSSLPISAYIAIACAVSLMSVFLLAETHKRDLGPSFNRG